MAQDARLYDHIKDLPLRIDGYALEPRSRPFGEFTRATTTFRLSGGGETGVGEDVTYDESDQLRQQAAGPVLPLAGEWTFDGFSRHLDDLDLFHGTAPGFAAYHDYRRWGIESAALDLALRQAGEQLHAVLGREPRQLSFGVSLRLGDPPSAAGVHDRLAAYGTVRYKLDAEPGWSEDLIAELAATGTVDVIDFKGAYKGTPVDVDTDPELYRRVADAFPNAYLEDPDLNEETTPVLEPHSHRITWDAALHSLADVVERNSKAINSKPSRFGSLRELMSVYEHCEREGIAIYGGGQGETGPGRGQIEYLASLFHPDTPNDEAPSGYNDPSVPDGLATSPMDPMPSQTGFRWGEESG